MVMHINWPEEFKAKVMEFDWVSVIDFWAEWCGPCRMIGPIMEELTTDNAGKKVQIVKINVDENPELATTFNISSIPVVFFVKEWKVAHYVIGANPKQVYQQKIDELS